jgi:uncharacterized protein
MKLQPDQMDAQAVTAYDKDWIAINGEKHHESLLISSEGQKDQWGLLRAQNLTPTHLEQLIELKNKGIELVILGSGQKLQFMPKLWLQAFNTSRLGFETMDTPAACRTYNILAGEGRKVEALLLIEPQND